MIGIGGGVRVGAAIVYSGQRSNANLEHIDSVKEYVFKHFKTVESRGDYFNKYMLMRVYKISQAEIRNLYQEWYNNKEMV